MARRERTKPEATQAVLLAMQDSICSNAEASTASDRLLLQERARCAVDWITTQRPDLTFGAQPTLLRISQPDTGSLVEFEDYGRNGNAILLKEADFGQVWWCDPEGREVSTSRFAFTKGPGFRIAYEIRFQRDVLN